MVAVNETLERILFAIFVRSLSLSIFLSCFLSFSLSLLLPFSVPSYFSISVIFKPTVDVIKFITIANIYCGTQWHRLTLKLQENYVLEIVT